VSVIPPGHKVYTHVGYRLTPSLRGTLWTLPRRVAEQVTNRLDLLQVPGGDLPTKYENRARQSGQHSGISRRALASGRRDRSRGGCPPACHIHAMA
jgi:hypothetical protein